MASVAKRKWTSPSGEKKEAWVVRYKDGTGAHRGRTFVRKKEADAFSLQVGIELQQNRHIARSQTATVGELLDHYLEAVDLRHKEGRRMSDSHHRTIHMMFRVHVRPSLAGHKLTDLTFDNIDTWGRTLSKNPRLSAATVKRILHLFKVAMDYAVRRGWVHRNIVADVMREYRGGRKDPIRTFTKAEVRRVLNDVAIRQPNYTERSALYTRCFVYVATFCGLRIGEIAGLKVEHIDFDRTLIEVRHSLTDLDKLKGPKTRAGIRDVPMPAIVASALREWITRFYIPNERGLVFRRGAGGFMSPQNFHHNYWRKLLDRCDLGPDQNGRRFHFHALRHFCASMMVEQGVPLTDAAELLGHSSFDMTLQVYAHAIIGGERRVQVLQGMADNLLQLPSPGLNLLPNQALAA